MHITRRNFLSLCSVAGASLLSRQRARAAVKQRPNVLWIVNDASRAQNYGCYGYGRNTSPNVDALAKRGVVCEQAYTQAFWTSPSVSSYMTSRYFPEWPTQWTAYGDSVLMHPPKDEVLAPALFGAHGYRTLLISCNAGYVSTSSRLGLAFQETCLPDSGDTGRVLDNGQPYHQRSFKTVNDSLLPWLQQSEKPFFVYAHGIETHAPYVIPPEAPCNQWIDEGYHGDVIDDRYNVAFPPQQQREVSEADRAQLLGLYDGCIRFADHHLGILFDVLAERNLLENTLVVYTSDHGEALFDDGKTHGHTDLYAGPDETHHIPLILAGPGVPEGRRIAAPTQSIDILPTLAALCGIPIAGRIDGSDLLRADNNETPRFAATRQGDPLAGTLKSCFVCNDTHKMRWDHKAGQALTAWTLPHRAADPEPVEETAQEALAALRTFVEKTVEPQRRHAIENQIPRAYLFAFSNKKLVGRARRAGTEIIDAAAPDDERCWRYFTNSNAPAYLTGPSGSGLPPLKFSIPSTPGAYRLLIEMRAPDDSAANTDTRVAEFAVRNRGTHEVAGTLTAAHWDYVTIGPVELPRGYAHLELRPARPGLMVRRLLIFPDNPGAEAYAREILLGEEVQEQQQEREEALEALGYI
ncbi:MAG: sulfatase [Candidatus Hydrogenedentota bacterium]